MSHIQVYVKIEDVYPTEHWLINLPPDPSMLVDPAEKILYKTGGNCLTAWKEDIRQNGILNQMKIHPSGLVGDGNGRYWCKRELWQETHDARFRYLPIDLNYFMGLNYQEGILNIRKSLLNDGNFYLKRPIQPSRQEFPKIDLDSLHKGDNPYSRVTQLASFKEIK